MYSYIKFADTLSTSMGKAFSWCIVILMGGTCYEVIMAYAFNAPTLWNFDFSLQMYGAIFMMAGAYTLATEAHVRGDVIYRLFPTKVQGWIDLILYFIFFFPGVIALAFYGYEYAAKAWMVKETSWNSPAQIQIYMANSLIPVSVRLVETIFNHLKNIPHMFYMDSIGGVGFEPEHYVDISSVIDIKTEMLDCHISQNDWLIELFDDTPSNMMRKQSSYRGYIPGYKYAEGFRQVLTYPLVGSYKLLP